MDLNPAYLKDAAYYFADGNVTILVSKTLFNVRESLNHLREHRTKCLPRYIDRFWRGMARPSRTCSTWTIAHRQVVVRILKSWRGKERRMTTRFTCKETRSKGFEIYYGRCTLCGSQF